MPIRRIRKVQELRDLAMWSEGMVWSSPERHGAMSAIIKAQIDWIPLSTGGVRPTQGKTLALKQVCGGSQSFNAVNQMRILGRWMRMVMVRTSLRCRARGIHRVDFPAMLRLVGFLTSECCAGVAVRSSEDAA